MAGLWLVLFSGILLEVRAAVLVTDYDQSRVVELRGHMQACILHTDRNRIENLIESNKLTYIPKLSHNELDAFYASCRDTDQLNKRGGFIFPGTLWCGPGNIASSYSDLGPLVDEDKCCREHDHCPNQLEPGQCRQGICNTSPFTRSHCDCDKTFKRCLRQVNSSPANIIGLLYFNIAQVTCFKDRRLCPMYMREDSSYTWFCEEWKFEPSGEFNASLLSKPLTNQIVVLPMEPVNAVTGQPPESKIQKNLETFSDKDSNTIKIMTSLTHKNMPLQSGPPKHSSPILNLINKQNVIWRD